MSSRMCYVSGRVQGVFYRETTRNKALSLGITGHAINLTDGRVEVLMSGSSQQLDIFETWLWEGSTWSSVSDVQCHSINSAQPEYFTTG